MKNTLWIDMTDLSRWKGHFTGVQRVVYEIARRYAEYDNVKYFVYDDRTRKFYETPFSVIQKILIEPPKQTATVASRPKQLAMQFARVPKGLYNKLPEETKQRIPAGFKKTAKFSLKMGEKAARTILHQIRESRSQRINQEIKNSATESEKSIFQKGDAILLMGASWDSDTKMKDIAQERIDHDLKFIQLIHDVIPSFYPHLFGPGFFEHFNRAIFESLANADLLLAVSQASKDETIRLCKVMRIPAPRVEVIRLGDDFAKNQHPECPDESLVGQDFIISLGTYEIRKNSMLLYYAVHEARLRGIKIPKIIIVGRKGWLTQDLSYMLDVDPDVQGALVHMSSVSDSQLAWLFENCKFSIFPSVFEGWGLPIGESLFYGKPCLSSYTSSMPEVGGDLVDYFSPYDSGACLDAIVSYNDDAVLAKKSARIKANYQTRSWDETFDQTIEFTSDLIKLTKK